MAVDIPNIVRGYFSGIFGKWHLGDVEGRYPTDQGFDEWIGIPRSSDRAFWPDSNSFQPDSHPNVKFTHVMSSVKGKKPIELEIFDGLKGLCLIERSLITPLTLLSDMLQAEYHSLHSSPIHRRTKPLALIQSFMVPPAMVALQACLYRLMFMLVNCSKE